MRDSTSCSILKLSPSIFRLGYRSPSLQVWSESVICRHVCVMDTLIPQCFFTRYYLDCLGWWTCVDELLYGRIQVHEINTMKNARGLLEFYLLAKFMVISGQVPTCDLKHSWRLDSASQMGDQATSTMHWYPTQSHYPDRANQYVWYPNNPECLTRKWRVSIFKSLVWHDRFEPVGLNLMIYQNRRWTPNSFSHKVIQNERMRHFLILWNIHARPFYIAALSNMYHYQIRL